MEHCAQVILYTLLMSERCLCATFLSCLAGKRTAVNIFRLYLTFSTLQVPEAYWPWPSVLSTVRSDSGKSKILCAFVWSHIGNLEVNELWMFVKGISVQRSDLVGLIIRRNELANDILVASTTQQLPPMLQVCSDVQWWQFF